MKTTPKTIGTVQVLDLPDNARILIGRHSDYCTWGELFELRDAMRKLAAGDAWVLLPERYTLELVDRAVPMKDELY